MMQSHNTLALHHEYEAIQFLFAHAAKQCELFIPPILGALKQNVKYICTRTQRRIYKKFTKATISAKSYHNQKWQVRSWAKIRIRERAWSEAVRDDYASARERRRGGRHTDKRVFYTRGSPDTRRETPGSKNISTFRRHARVHVARLINHPRAEGSAA